MTSGNGAPKTAIVDENTTRGTYPSTLRADRLEQQADAVEIDAIAAVEVGLGTAGRDGGEVEDDVGPARDQSRRRRRERDTSATRVATGNEAPAGTAGATTSASVSCGDRRAADRPVARQALGELAPEHARATRDQDPHDAER